MKREHTVGVVSPPRWLDIAPSELQKVAAGPVPVVQTVIDAPGFTYAPETMAELMPEVERGARVLAETGVAVLAQSGTQFSLGFTADVSTLERRRDELQVRHGVPVVFNGLAIVDALRALEARTVAVAGTYYNESFHRAFVAFLEGFGLTVAAAETWVGQGFFPSQQAVDDLGWHYDNAVGIEAVRRVAGSAPGVDCVVLPGAEIRTVGRLGEIEADIGCPLVAADTAFYWAILRAAQVPAGGQADGALFALPG